MRQQQFVQTGVVSEMSAENEESSSNNVLSLEMLSMRNNEDYS